MTRVVEPTKRGKLKSGLPEREATLNAVMEAVRDAVAILDSDGKIVFWNTAAEHLFGYSQEEILGKDLHRLVVPEKHLYKEYSNAFKHFQSTGEGDAIGKIIEMKAKNKDGLKFHIELSVSALRTGDAWHSVGIVRDISKRKQAQEELEKSLQRYSDLSENSPIGIISCDREGNITYVNQMILEILGSTSIEETKKINLLTFPLLIKYGFSKKLEECLQNNKSALSEIVYKSKWGKRVWLSIHFKPQVNKETVVGAQMIIDDITERKRLERKLFLLSVTDTLTKAYNRRYAIQKLEEEIERSKRMGGGFSVIMLDLDNFKSVNDRFGHNTGDLVLKTVTRDIKKKIRKIDTLARWGGEEFIILLPETTINKAAVLAERLREGMSKLDIPGVGTVTASFGIAGYHPGDTVDKVIQASDKMMYEAKSAGRNCVRYLKE